MRIAPALAAAVAVLALPAAAGAQVVTLPGFPRPELEQGPALAGDRVAWAQSTCLEGCDPEWFHVDGEERYEIFAAPSSGPKRRLFRARVGSASSGPNFFREWYSFLLSEEVLATARETYEGDEVEGESGSVKVVAGPLGRSPTQLVDCSVELFDGVVPIALDGSRLAYDPDPCDDAGRLVLHDLATGEVSDLPESATGSYLRVRGRYAAWLGAEGGGARVVVYDLAAGRLAYSAPAADVLDLDLDADGGVAIVSGSERRPCGTGRLFRYSPEAPSPAEVAAPVCATGVRIDAGRIFYIGWEGFTRTLRVLQANGSSQDVVRFGRVDPGRFDAEGERVAWAARDCSGGQAIFTAALADTPLDAGSINCRARFRSGTVRVRRGIATVGLRCPRGCGGELSLRHLGRRDFSLLRGEDEVRLRLRPGARARLERRGSLQALAKLVTYNRAGDRSARSRAVTLVTSRYLR